jgi:hypothetical protein
MYISINKEWFEKNKSKLGHPNEEDLYCIETEGMLADVNMDEGINCKFYLNEDGFDSNVYVSLDAQLAPENVVDFVEQSMDDIHGDAFAKIIELMVKKLNKFKNLIESVRGL